MTNRDIIDLGGRYLFQIYPRAPLAIVRGKGCRVWDADGKEYLDFFGSTVVVNLGHCHPAITRALTEQANTILHVSNLHHSVPQAQLAERLVTHSFADRAFLCNSGAEANEAAIKLARKYGADHGDGRYEIVTMLGSFHGRTIATIAATGQEKVRRGFQPLPEGFRYVPYNDVAAVERAITDRTIAVMLEPVLGEGGIVAATAEFMQRVRELCDRRNVLLILDEVQTGMGRLGTLFGYELSGIAPDIMTLGKGLGNGVPIGAMLATERVAAAFAIGAHGTTFGGNALTCAVATAVVDTLLQENVLANCRAMGDYLRERLRDLQRKHPMIKDVRGHGLLVGVELAEPGAAVVDRCREAGLILNCTAEKVLRLSPPLVVGRAEVDEAVAILAKALSS
ncbi:MAG TPA: aspartate aminotransferase family protein [Candidatus Binatia bacterium]|nr:aspartate aminotransferase family protein [Candidatus Binatia bacterium]